MNKTIQWLKSHIIASLVLALLIGLVLGALVFRGQQSAHQHAETDTKQVWTCSMDPQVRQDHPGTCPICGMDLIPLAQTSTSTSTDPNAVTFSEEAAALANIQTQVVGTAQGSKEIRLFGKVEPDQRLQQSQAAYVAGRVERLLVNAVGDVVKRGQPLATIYSPELYTAAQELVAAMDYLDERQRKPLVQAAIEKLTLLNVANEDIKTLMRTRKPSPHFTLHANTSGTVVAKNVQQGDYVKQGDALLQIANLSRVWVVFKAYESDLPFVKVGARVQFATDAMPGTSFEGRVSFVDPVINNDTRTAGVRIEMANGNGQFKPEMLITGRLAVNAAKGGQIVVPKSAVLWTGKRSVVYVKDDSEELPTFSMRQITLGASLPDAYVVTDGLAEGEEIAINGVFAIDASAQLEGKRSM